MGDGSILPTLGSAQDFLPFDASCTYHTQIDLDTDMEEETGTAQSKGNKKRVLMKLKGSSSSFRRENMRNEASSGKDIARALAKLSPGGMSEFVQHVPASVAGSLIRFAAQSRPLRLWPNEQEPQNEARSRSGPAGSASRSLSGYQATKVVFNVSPSEYSGLQSAKPGLFSAGEPASVFTGTAGVVAGCGAVAVPSGTETDLSDVEFCGAVAAPSGTETELCDAQFPVRAGAGKGDARHLSRGALVPQWTACCVWVAGFDTDVLLSCRVENPSARVARVNTALHNLCLAHSSSIPAHNSHARMSVARCVVNAVGDTEDGGRLSCVLGGTKSLSMSTRCGVRRSAVDEYDHPQQAPLKLHVETWAGLLRNQGLRFSQEKEIVPGCAVAVACPSCPDHYPVSPGPGRIIRNMLGWTLEEKTDGCGVWFCRSPSRGESFFFHFRSRWLGSEGMVPHSVVGSL